MKKAGLVVLLLAVVLVSVPALAQPPAQLAARVQKRYQTINAIEADYKRDSRFKAAGSLSRRNVKGSGRLIWARPSSLRLEQTKPRKETIVADGKEVWWARLDRKRADHYPSEAFTAGLKPLLDAMGGLASLDAAFNLEPVAKAELPAAEGVQALALAPKRSRADLKRLVIWFDAQTFLLKGFRIVSLVGDITEYQLENIKVNPDLAKDTFSYRPPDDFQVRTHRMPQ